VKGFGDTAFHTGADYPKDKTKDMAAMLAMLYLLLGLASPRRSCPPGAPRA
jgi:hypothetical protein